VSSAPAGRAVPEAAEPVATSRRARWSAFVGAVRGVSEIDPATVQTQLQRLGSRRRWLAPLVFAAGTVAVVFRGVLVLVRNWRLLLLQVIPAAWLWLMSWNVRTHLFSREKLPTEYTAPLAIGVIVLSLVCYWCNATFAFTLTQAGRPRIRSAFREARGHWRLVTGIALVTGAAQAAVWVWLAPVSVRWFLIGLTAMLVIQTYLFIAVPLWLLGFRPREDRRTKITRSVTTGVLGGVASAPGFLFNRLGLLLLGIHSVWILGVVLVSVGAVLQVTASSSVRVVKMSARLGGGSPSSAGDG
jgi:hypothetical protein